MMKVKSEILENSVFQFQKKALSDVYTDQHGNGCLVRQGLARAQFFAREGDVTQDKRAVESSADPTNHSDYKHAKDVDESPGATTTTVTIYCLTLKIQFKTALTGTLCRKKYTYHLQVND